MRLDDAAVLLGRPLGVAGFALEAFLSSPSALLDLSDEVELDGPDFLAVAPVGGGLLGVVAADESPLVAVVAPVPAAFPLGVAFELPEETVPAVAFGATFVVGGGGLSAGAAFVLAGASGAVGLVPLFGTASARDTWPTSSANPRNQLGLAVSIPRCSHGSDRRSNFQRAPRPASRRG
jgi:hypothetical protein